MSAQRPALAHEMTLSTSPVHLLDSERKMLGALRSGPRVPADGREQDTVLSLARFDLVKSTYVRPEYEAGKKVSGGWTYELSDLGDEVATWLTPSLADCCEKTVRLNCVCREKHGCIEHGERCHGTHD